MVSLLIPTVQQLICLTLYICWPCKKAWYFCKELTNHLSSGSISPIDLAQDDRTDDDKELEEADFRTNAASN